jgi:hypothetical protein
MIAVALDVDASCAAHRETVRTAADAILTVRHRRAAAVAPFFIGAGGEDAADSASTLVVIDTLLAIAHEPGAAQAVGAPGTLARFTLLSSMYPCGLLVDRCASREGSSRQYARMAPLVCVPAQLRMFVMDISHGRIHIRQELVLAMGVAPYGRTDMNRRCRSCQRCRGRKWNVRTRHHLTTRSLCETCLAVSPASGVSSSS